MRVGVIGINHKLANLGLRELLAKACQRCFVGGSYTQESHTFILLNTCNRTEIYFSSDDLAASHTYLLQLLRCEVHDEFDQKVYSYFGHDCFLHLARVTAGLDSAIVAESEIQGQVKAAYEQSANCILLPNELHYLFQKALKVGKQVRTELGMGRGMPDLEHAIFSAGTHLLSSGQSSKILFVGASEVNCKIISFLKSKQLKDISLCNRSAQQANKIAEQHDLTLVEWSQLSCWHQYHWIIVGTKAPHFLITKNDFPKSCLDQKLIIDLSVPRNVDPLLGRDPRITLLNIDQINRILKVRRQKMAHALTTAEKLISSAAKKHVEIFQEKERLRSKYLSVSAL